MYSYMYTYVFCVYMCRYVHVDIYLYLFTYMYIYIEIYIPQTMLVAPHMYKLGHSVSIKSFGAPYILKVVLTLRIY